jgi:hypothetical protein
VSTDAFGVWFAALRMVCSVLRCDSHALIVFRHQRDESVDPVWDGLAAAEAPESAHVGPPHQGVLNQRGWHWLRHPPGWWDEIDAVYGGHEEPGASKSAGAAGLGGNISGGLG